MSFPQKIFLYFIVDVMSRSLYVDGGVVKRSAMPIPLPQHPRGWEEVQISFGTNQRYFSLNRSFTVPMSFVGDGATIIRDAIYAGKGYEEELYILILKQNAQTGVYEREYHGRLDFSKKIDEPRKWITVNAIEGGVLSYLNANDGVEYEITLDQSNTAAKKLFFDGTNLFDRYRYSVVPLEIVKPNDFDHHTVVSVLPFPFISNEGDSVGVIQGSQSYEEAVFTGAFSYSTITAFVANSGNYFFSSVYAIQTKLTGKIIFDTIGTGANTMNVEIFVVKNNGTRFNILPLTTYNFGEHVELDVNLTIDVDPNEKLFLMALCASNSINQTSIFWRASDVFVSFNSKVPPTQSYCLEPLDMLKQLVSKMTEGKYTADSVFFSTHKNIVKTSTNALRNLTDANGAPTTRVIKQSFQDWFTDYDCLYNLGMKVVNNVLWIEPKEDLYNDDAEVLDLGEITDLKITYAEDLLCNTASFGYKSQDYRQRNGKYEFNTTTKFKLPVNTIKRDYTKICRGRGDCYGIEFTRAMSFDKPTTDATGDNQVFMINAKPLQEDIVATVGFVAAQNFMIVPLGIAFVVGDIIDITGSNDNDHQFEVIGIGNLFFFQFIFLSGANPVVDETDASVLIHFVLSKSLTVNRANYTSITGVLDNTVYNVEEMTPHRMMLAHGASLKSILFQLQPDKVTFVTADKNADLATVLAAITIAEKQDEVVSGFKAPIHLPFYFEFLTPVPLSFSKILSSIGTGYISMTFYGQRLYALPIGKMDGKPAINQPQTWKMLVAPKNNLTTLQQLSDEGIFYSDTMGNSLFLSKMNPTHFVKYNYALPAKYQHKEIYDDHFHNRNGSFISQASYTQKWQKTDTIKIQAISRGIGVPQITIYDAEAQVVDTFAMTVTPDAAVQLPYILLDASIDLNAYEEGIYFIIISVGATKLYISEYFNVADEQPGTLLYEYYHTSNKYAAFWNSFKPMIRVESLLLPWYPDATFSDYTDELADVEVIDGIPVGKRMLRLGRPAIPDYLGLKMNNILLCNRSSIEGLRYSRTADSKMEKKEFSGHNMFAYLLEISKATNTHGIAVNEDGSGAEETTVIFTLDAQAFGTAAPGSIINIEVEND